MQKITVTHPFSPYLGEWYFVVDEIGWGEDRILCCDSNGNSQIFSKSWTDYPVEGPENPFIGKIDFWYNDLKMLANLIADIDRL